MYIGGRLYFENDPATDWMEGVEGSVVNSPVDF